MTFQELQNLVSYWVDDLNFGYFTAAQVQVFLNNAQREVQKLLIQAGENYYLKPVETSTVANQADYVFPSDFVEMLRAEVVLSGSGINEDKRQLTNITLNMQDIVVSTKTGAPQCYIIRRDRMTLLPCPDKAYTLRIYYSYRVSDMSAGSDEPDVPEDYHEYIAILAAENCFIKDDRVPTNLLEKKKYYEDLLKKAAEDRDQSQSRSVRVTTDDGFGSLF